MTECRDSQLPRMGTTSAQQEVVQKLSLPQLPPFLQAGLTSLGEPQVAQGVCLDNATLSRTKDVKLLDPEVPCIHSHSVLPGFSQF